MYYQTSNSDYPTKNQDNRLPRSCARVVYIAGDTLRHQPMGAGHVTVLQFRGPITFCVLQWCHPTLTRTQRRTSCSARMITLYGDRKRIQARADTVNVYIGMTSDKTIAIIGREAYNSLTSKPDSAYPRILTIPIDG